MWTLVAATFGYEPRPTTHQPRPATTRTRAYLPGSVVAWKGRRYTYHGNVALEIKFDDRRTASWRLRWRWRGSSTTRRRSAPGATCVGRDGRCALASSWGSGLRESLGHGACGYWAVTAGGAHPYSQAMRNTYRSVVARA
eukprot:77952-Prymnesium_polylepis.1